MSILCFHTQPSLKSQDTNLPQGSCAFTAYLITLKTSVHKFQENDGGDSTDSISLNGFADDHSFNKAFCLDTNEAEQNTTRILEHSLKDISYWITMNHLRMNPTKTDFIYLGLRVQVGKCLQKTINVFGNSIDHIDVIKPLGAHINQYLSFKHHIRIKCKTAMHSLLRIKHIRKYLTQDAAQILISSLVMSHLD